VADSKAPSWAELLKPNGWKSERVFLVVCLRPQQLAHVGWFLFHSHFQNLCRVISTSGGAEARASAYPKPSAT
jgi:hypothetical protein